MTFLLKTGHNHSHDEHDHHDNEEDECLLESDK